MERINKNLISLIGSTPLVEVTNIEKKHNLKARLVVKLESFNPGGSAKDRIALAMIEDAEKNGRLPPGGTIIEPTSGNTGIGLAWIAAVKGYHLILTMPETMSIERRKLLAALGAEIILTPGTKGMNGAIEKARELNQDIPDSIILQQFSNPANTEIHYNTTGKEIWEDTGGNVDILVAGVGTGGTLCGSAKRLKEYNPELVAIAVEPAGSAVLSGGAPGPHKIQGIGAGFVPDNFNKDYVDRIVKVTDEDAFETARLLVKEEGILAGISSGAALCAGIEEAKKEVNKGKTVVVVLPDTGERYLSTTLFEQV